MKFDPAQFRATLGRFATGVTILTMRDERGIPHGMTVTSFASVSLDPPLVLVCIGHEASLAAPLERTQHFAVNVLAAEQEAAAHTFAATDVDRFGGFMFELGVGDVPILAGSHAHVECRVHARHPAGDHTIIVGEVLHGATSDGEPLLYYRGRYGRFAP